jgi:TP901 family phage tail tape measure protein
MAQLQSQLILSLIDKVTAPARGIQDSINNLTRASQENAQRMNEVRGRMVDAVAAGYMLYRGLSAPISAAADFETAMNRVVALSSATGEQFDALSQQARELGRTTQFTASEAADAMGFLAMAGFGANEILGAMPGTLQLASSAQMDLARAADIVSNVLTGYGKDVSELAHVNDVLVKAFTSANTDLEQLAEAMKYAGPVASAAGVQFEQAAAALALMGNAGIQGSMAGTSLRGAMTRILNPTKQVSEAMNEAGLSFTDSAGRLLPLDAIIQQLEPHADDAGLMMRLFGQRAGPAMAALVGQGSEALRELQGELENSGGTAQRISEVQMSGFNGQMKAFRSAVEGMNIAIGSALLPALTSMVNGLTAALGPITAMAERFPRVASAIVGVTSAIVAFRVAALASQYAGLFMKGALIDIAIHSLRAAQGMGRVAAAVALQPTIAAFGALRSAVIGYSAAAAVAGHGVALKAMGASLLGLLNPLRVVRLAFVGLRVALISTGIGAILVGVAAAGTWIYNNWSGIAAMFTEFGSAFLEAIQPVMPMLQPVIDGVSSLVGWVSGLVGPLDATGESWAAMGRSAGEGAGSALVTIVELPGKMIALAGEFIDVGVRIAQSLWDGVKRKIDEMIEWFRGLPRRIIAAIGSIDIASIIKWPSLPAWAGGGGGKSAVDGERAEGGPVTAGRTYLVGEEGPELFSPGRTGVISPNEVYASARTSQSPAMAGLSRGSVSMGDINISVALHGAISSSAQAVGRAIGDEVRKAVEGTLGDGGI